MYYSKSCALYILTDLYGGIKESVNDCMRPEYYNFAISYKF
jgi:hypothetical protein